MRGVRVRFHGFEYACWPSHGGRTRRVFQERKDLFDQEATLFGHPALDIRGAISDAVNGIFSKEQYDVLEPGTYTYDFDFRLPDDLPGDFESLALSRIAYELTAYVDMPLKLDISTTLNLTVYETDDPNEIQPVTRKVRRRSPIGATNSIELAVTLDRDRFFPGDQVNGTALIANRSQRHIRAIAVTVNQIVDLSARGFHTSQVHPTPVLEIREPEVSRGKATPIPVAFEIPRDLYSSVSHSALVRVSYEVCVSVDVARARDLMVRLPITIIEKAGAPAGVERGDA